jgi:hypothetical protein
VTPYERALIRESVREIMQGARPAPPFKAGSHLTCRHGRFCSQASPCLCLRRGGDYLAEQSSDTSRRKEQIGAHRRTEVL